MNPFVAPGDRTSMLNPRRRARELDALADGRTVDVLVVGGGVTGTGVALDAASRGLSVALIEKHDLAFGTSRWSSKLVHGGLRYLASGRIDIAWESAVERALVMTFIAPHLTRSLGQLIPIMTDMPRREARLDAAGFRAGDLLRRASRMPKSVLPPPRVISAERTLKLAPTLDPRRVRGGILGWDGQLEDDARLVVAIARTAAAYGASILPRCRADSLHPDGARVTDAVTGQGIDIRAHNVINATGVWAGDLDRRVALMPSLGSHVVLRSEAMGNPGAAVTVPVPGHLGRFIFAMPQRNGLTYVGLTDEPIEGAIPDVPVAPVEDLDWILAILSRDLAEPLTRADAVGSYAGVRPLVRADDPSGESADISRRHVVLGGPGEVVTITGGKLTTYRRMAQDAVDRITRRRCRTRTLPLVGAGPQRSVAAPDLPERLVRRFGSEAPRVAAMAGRRPELLEPLGQAVGSPADVLGVELLWGAAAEGALCLEDLLERRTRLSLVPADEAAVRGRAESIVGDLLERPDGSFGS